MADPKQVRDALATAAAVDGDATKMTAEIAEKLAPEKAAGNGGEEYDNVENEEEEETGGFEDDTEEEEEEEEEEVEEEKPSLTALLLGGEGAEEEEEEEEEDEYKEEGEDAAAKPHANGNGTMPAAKAVTGEKRTRDEKEDEHGVNDNAEQGAKKVKA